MKKFKDISKFCISLKRCADRKIKVQQEFDKFNLDVSFFEATDKYNIVLPEGNKKTTGIIACMTSHKRLIQKAKDENLEYICIFEDDIYFSDDFTERIKYIENIKDFDFDILYLGGHFNKDGIGKDAVETKYGKHIYKLNYIAGTYGYIVKNTSYDFILNNCNENFGIDEFYCNIATKNLKIFGFLPFMVSCIPCVSEITNIFWHYENVDWFFNKNKIELK